MAAPRPLIVLTGGGTAGHVSPALALAERLAERFDLVFAGSPYGPEKGLALAAGLRFVPVTAAGLARKGVLARMRALAMTGWGLAQAAAHLRRLRPRAVVGTGGYVSGPVGWAAGQLHIPLYLLEPDARLGVANRLLARKARRLFLSFPDLAARLPEPLRHKAVGTGLPVRQAIGRVDRHQARQQMGLDPERPVLLVFGGSLGAVALNQMAERVASAPEAADVQLIWATGRRYRARVAVGPGPGRVVVPYLEDMASAMAAADLALTRAGAGTIAELAQSGLPALLVPSPNVSDDQQLENARRVEGAGGGLVIAEVDLAAEATLAQILDLLHDPSRLVSMRDGMRRTVPAGAAERIADMLIADLLGERP